MVNNFVKIIFMVIFFSSCSALDKKQYISSYLEEIDLSQKNINKNYIGMTRRQILYIFGKPIISDSFDDAYHYLIYSKKDKNICNKMTLNLYFKNDKVLDFDIK